MSRKNSAPFHSRLTTEDPLLILKDVSLLRGGKTILNNISWEVKRGEHWFILGPNGSGKTSLLEIVTGYLWASRGQVKVLGEVYGKTNLPELRKRIGYAAPWIAKHIKPHESVREVVAGGLEATIEYFKELDAEVMARIHRALSRMDCESLADAIYAKLSSGEQLKVLIARALVREPEILILDEPFSSLDVGSRHSIQKLVEKLGNGHQKTSILIVTHHFDDIAPFYTHGLILKGGKGVISGTKASVLTSSVLTAAFDTPIKLARRSQRYFLQ